MTHLGPRPKPRRLGGFFSDPSWVARLLLRVSGPVFGGFKGKPKGQTKTAILGPPSPSTRHLGWNQGNRPGTKRKMVAIGSGRRAYLWLKVKEPPNSKTANAADMLQDVIGGAAKKATNDEVPWPTHSLSQIEALLFCEVWEQLLDSGSETNLLVERPGDNK